jgi:hypothetical protein
MVAFVLICNSALISRFLDSYYVYYQKPFVTLDIKCTDLTSTLYEL